MQVTITYDKSKIEAVADVRESKSICDIFVPGSGAFSTNVHGLGIDDADMKRFMEDQVTHPGLLAAIQKAVESKAGVYTFTAPTDAYTVPFLESVGKALKSRGIPIEVVLADPS